MDVATITVYVDDTILTFSASNTASLESQINNELKWLTQWLIANKLTLNVSKTKFMVITTRQKRSFICDIININIDNGPVNQVKSVKVLDLHLGQTLSWSNHIEHIFERVGPALGLLKRVYDCVDHGTLVNIYKTLILPHLPLLLSGMDWIKGLL